MPLVKQGGKLRRVGGLRRMRAQQNVPPGYVSHVIHGTDGIFEPSLANGTPIITLSIAGHVGAFTATGAEITSGSGTNDGTPSGISVPLVAATFGASVGTRQYSGTLDWAGPGGTSGQLPWGPISISVVDPNASPVTRMVVQIHNTGAGSVAIPRARFGIAFPRGVFPSGAYAKARRTDGTIVGSAMCEVALWGDGTLRKATMCTADASGSLAVGGSRTYEVYGQAGTHPVSSFNPLTWLAAHGSDWTVDITSRTGFTTGALGNLAFGLKAALATTTRFEVQENTSRFVRVKCWQKVSGEEHLIAENYLDFWLDTDGATPLAVEWAPVLSQHWWIAAPFGTTQTKERQTYTATVKYGATTLDTRAALAHAYYCRWASLRSANDAQHGRKHWIDLGSAPLPTIRVQYTDAALITMMKAGAIPPLKLGVAYTTPATATYAPLGTNGHRAGIDSTGSYAGRGMWGDPDAKVVSLQAQATAEAAWRSARVHAQAGLAVGFHARDHRSTTGVNGGTDTTNRVIPTVLRKAATLGLSQSYAGLAGAAVYSKGTSFNSTTGLTLITHSAPNGGTGSFTTSDNASHMVNYSGPMAFLEGERYLADAVLSHFSSLLWRANFNQYAADRPLWPAAAPRGIAQSIPNASASGGGWGMNLPLAGQDREVAWVLAVTIAAWTVLSDSQPEMSWYKNVVLNWSDLVDKSLAYFTVTQKRRAGFLMESSALTSYAPWMQYWQALAAYQGARALDFLPTTGRGYANVLREGAEYAANLVALLFENSQRSLSLYHSIYGTDANSVTMLPDDEWPHQIGVAITSNVFTGSQPISGFAFTNGDKCRFVPRDAGFGTVTLPVGITAFTLYYLVNVSGNTFQLATSPGGSPITVADTTLAARVQAHITFQVAATAGPATSAAAGDSRDMMGLAVLEQAYGEGHPLVDATVINAARTHMAAAVAATTQWATWNYDGGNLT